MGVRQLRRDIEILKEAVRQDERKFKSQFRQDLPIDAELSVEDIEKLQKNIQERESEVAKLQEEIAADAAKGSPKRQRPPALMSPGSSCDTRENDVQLCSASGSIGGNCASSLRSPTDGR